MLVLKSNDPDLELYLGRNVKVGNYVEGTLIKDELGIVVKTSSHTYVFCDNITLSVEILEG